MNETSFPLCWPPGRGRTNPGRRERARFSRRGSDGWKRSLTIEEARLRLNAELERLGARRPILSTNLRLRNDGWPASNQTEPSDPGAAVYIELNGQKTCFACDRWDRVADNISAIAHTIEALRGIERWGSGEMVRAAFTGFRALPAMERPWREVLGIEPGSEVTPEQIQSAYLTMSKRSHPDAGGDHVAMADVNRARDAAFRELEVAW